MSLARGTVAKVGVSAFLCSVLALVTFFGHASADVPVSTQGSAAGQTLSPLGLAVDPSNGDLYVADRGNRRVDLFPSTGPAGFQAFGWGVVASGPDNKPKNEIQQVEVAATGGNFTLLFIQNSFVTIGVIKEETVSVPFNASAAAVEGALEGLAPLGPDDVSVTGPDGGPWIIEFTGAFGDMDLHQLEQGQKTQLTGGLAKLQIQTLQDGANYEVCKASVDVCRAGQRGVQVGQLHPSSVAVDPSTHDFYVFDGLETSSHNEPENNRVQKFTTSGEFLYMLGGGVNLDTGEDICTAASGDTCGRGVKGTGSGEFNSHRSSVAIGPGGVLYVNDGDRVQKFEPSGAFIGEVSLPGINPEFLAVDSAGNIYSAVSNNEIRKYSPTGTQLLSLPVSNLNALALDPDDNLYATTLDSGEYGISRYDSSGSLDLVFYGAAGGPATALAPYPDATEGDVYAIENGVVNLLPLPASPGPVVYPVASSIFADPILSVKATLHSEINPEGKATTFHYEYVDNASFEDDGWGSSNVKQSSESAPIGSDFKLHPATQQLTGLTPETEYRFRTVASNADGTNKGPEGKFITGPPAKLAGPWSTDVGTESAVLHGEVNPLETPATGYFEYVDDATFQSSGFDSALKTPAGAPLDFGAGEQFVERSAQASGLEPGVTYRYRLVVDNQCKPDEPSVVCTFYGEVGTLRTFKAEDPVDCSNDAFHAPAGEQLADCRAYEMVSPVDKKGANIEVVTNVTGYPAGLDQTALDGDKITYSAYRAFAEPEGAPYTSQYMATRTSEGWENKSISPPREGPALFTTDGLEFQFKAFTEDLCLGWPLQDTALPLLAQGAISGYPNLYRRDNCDPDAGSYVTVTTGTPEGNDVEPRTFFPELQGFAADGSKAFFSVPAKLTSNARAEGVRQAYEAAGGNLKLVCVLPDGSVSPTGCSIGTASGFGIERNANVFGAVAEDGDVVYWTESEDGPGKLYARVGGTETITVSAQVAQFWGAAADGSKAFYTLGEKLSVFDLGTKTSTQIADGVRGLAGISRDGETAYFASTKALAGSAKDGKFNLFRYQSGNLTYIGTLSDADVLSGRPSPVSIRPLLRTSRVTPDGNRIIFMSKASLTGYENEDAASDELDSEVFIYDATANGGAGQLRCISCNPTGSRPNGQPWSISGVTGGWAAAWIPGWTNQLYAPRVISDDGNRAYFNSFDRLAEADTNGAQDVYQWEALGTGECEGTNSYGYVASADGCVTLISSGKDPEDSVITDSSATGDDVFFKTYESLYAGDPAFIDIYDARVGGGFSAPPVEAPECEGEACQAPGQTPTRPSAPQSSTFVGPGNPVVQPPKRKKCPKGKHRAKRKGKVVCVKNKKRAGKKKRAGNSRRASR